MKTIQLPNGRATLLDDEDYERINQHKWWAFEHRGRFSATRHAPRPSNKTIYMHREIMNAPDGVQVDHINGDSLDNRKINLRLCTNAENLRNRGKQINNTSGYKGVCWSVRKQKWQAQIKVDRKAKFLGNFETPEDAARAYDAAAKKYHGEFAKTNF